MHHSNTSHFNTSTLLYAGITLTVAFILKYIHAVISIDGLLFLLKPVNFFVGLFLGSHSVFIPDTGFYYPLHAVVIDRSCAGMNFLIISFCTLMTLSLPHYHGNRARVFLLMGMFALAYLLTVGCNVLRIVGALHLLHFKDRFAVVGTHWFHEAQGALFYLTGLIAASIAVHSLNKIIASNYAKLS